jgi:ferrous iron transport protein B
MFIVYYISVSTVGAWTTDWTQNVLMGKWIYGGIEALLIKINCADWLSGLVLDGIVSGVGTVLSFVPQMLVLFFFLSFLEACGYMSRIAFLMDKIFCKFGLSGKSFIPILIGTGCGVPGIMSSRTIENVSDRRMTIITTTFIPCGAKLPMIGLIAGALFNNSGWVAASCYFAGIAAIIISGIMLKKTKPFIEEPSPFVMELPPYHMPTAANVFHATWDRGWSFIKKAGTVITLSSIIIWFLQNFGFENGSFGIIENINDSILATIGNAIAWIFIPLGWGNWQSAVATVTGLFAKENIAASLGQLTGNGADGWDNLASAFTKISAYSFLLFNLLCAPCVAAMSAIRREMNSAKWTAFAIGYQCGFAYIISLIIYQFGCFFNGNPHPAGLLFAAIALAFIIFMLVRHPSAKKKELK